MRKVVVVVSPDFLHNEATDAYAARIRPLGLTAYGYTVDAASANVKRMFASMVNAHRARGDVEEWLNASGLEWHWLDEYSGDIKVEEVHATPQRRQAVAPSASPSSSKWEKTFPIGVAA